MHEGRAATGDDALLDRRAGRRDGVLDAVLALLELDLGGRADADDADAAGQLGQPLLQLLAVPVRVGVLDLAADLADPVLDRVALRRRRRSTVVSSLVTTTRRAVPSTSSPTWSSLRPTSGATTWPPVSTARSSSIALRRSPKPGALTATEVNRPADLVDDQGRERLAVDVLGDDQQRLAGLGDLLQQRQQVGHRRDLALVDQDVGVLEDGLHALRVGHHVRRDVALVELHALGELELEAHRVGLLDGDDAVLADLVERLGDQLADRGVLGRDAGDVGDVVLAVDVAGHLEQPGATRPRRPARCRA